jgi:signal transduction histidine kinase/ligand-binding sensor domain-containing protein/CheY-like chemotaxis protein
MNKYQEISLYLEQYSRLVKKLRYKFTAIAVPLLCWAAIAPLAKSVGRDSVPAKPITGFRQEVWKTEQGLPQNTVPAILQSSDGYLWVGTELGLVRFDGLRFTVFDKGNTPELKSNVVDALLQDREGNLWIGTVGGGLTRMRNGKFRTFTTKDGLSNDSILCLLEDPSGDLWIGTNGNGLNRLHDGHFTAYTSADGLADNQVFALAQGQDGALWVGTHDGLSRLYRGRFRTYRTAQGLANNYVRSLLMTPLQTLWIGTSGGGLSRLQDGKFKSFTTKDGLTSNSIVSLREDAGGSLWIGTLAGGLTRLSITGFSSYTSRNGLPSDDVWSIYRDRNDNLWVGTGGGGLIRLFNRTLFTAYDRRSGLSNDVTLPIFEDHRGDLWIGTNGGGLNRFHNGNFSAITTKDGLADDLVFTICEDLDGALWIGTRKGLNRLKDGKFTTYTKKDGLPSDIVITAYVDHEGTVWFGTRAGLSMWKHHQFTTFTTKDGLSNNVVQAIYEDSKHRLWIGTGGGGLDLFENGRFQVFDSHRGLSSNVVLAIHEAADGALWIGTDGGGLDRLKDGHFFAYTTKDGLPDDAVFQILEDASGALWMSSDRGVFRVSARALNDFAAKKIHQIPVVLYGPSDGMNTRECNGGFQPAGWKGRDGRLWFPTMQGVVVIDPKELTSKPIQQTTIVEHVVINDRRLPAQSSRLKVPPGAGNLEFSYSAPNLRSAHRIKFQYKLEGFDRNWVHAGQRRIAYYTNIPPGQYRFDVQASNEDGSWSSAGDSLRVVLQPHFYQTFVFYGLCIFGLIGLTAAAHLAHIRDLRERERMLERHVDERTAELRNEVAERERAELESVKAREAAERASQVKSEFLANMSHEIRTPMNGILGMTQLALATALSPDQQEYLGIIKDSADSLLTVIDDILDFSKVEAGKLNLDLIDFNLRQSLSGAVKSLAFRADQKGIRLAFHVDAGVPAIVHSDPVRLRQIILNLLGNAIKFTDQGEVELEVNYDESDASRPLLHLVVRDTGIGIPADKLASIFEAFSQADTTTTRKFGGTGLGLTICNRLVQIMGGSIWVTSEVDRGSEFHFTVEAGVVSVVGPNLKADDTEYATHQQSLAALANVGGSSRRILIAEDNPANRMVARLTLEKAGFQVYDVENGSAALDAARRFRFDAILMDCRMPVMDGYEAARHIRQLADPAGLVPIIALTASAFKEDRERAEQAGMNDFIAKPFEDRDLISKCLAWTKVDHDAAVQCSSEKVPNSSLPAAEKERLKSYSPEFVRSIMEIFLQTAPPVFDTLLTSVQNADWEQAKASAHWLRGGASRMIAPGLQQELEHMGTVCAAHAPSVSSAEIESLTVSFRDACHVAEAWLAEDRTCSTA